MKQIASFCVNHDHLEKGMYVSRIDGDVVTYDVRMAKPNCGVYPSNPVLHTLEHLLATYARNSRWSDQVVYVGPMGCRTGFYILVRDGLSNTQALELVKESLAWARDFQGTVPGTASSAECGNYLEHDLAGAKVLAADMLDVLKDWRAEDMAYRP